MSDPYLQHEAEIVERVQDNPTIITLRLRFTDPAVREGYVFKPGQFNMVYLYGVGEVAISIVSDPVCEIEACLYDHTFRVVGYVTQGLAKLKQGDRLGVRGPFGRGWPMEETKGKEVIVLTGGLGCAPSVSAINYIMARREEYGKLSILQGVKCAGDLIYCERYDQWRGEKNTDVLLSSDESDPQWGWNVGNAVENIAKLKIDAKNSVAMLCGPEGMMKAAAEVLLLKGISEQDVYLSLERNMKCGVGQCGHCQHGGHFVCKDGPVFQYAEIKALLGVPGF